MLRGQPRFLLASDITSTVYSQIQILNLDFLEFHSHIDLPHNALPLFLPTPTALLSFPPKHVNSLVYILLCCYVLILSYEYVNVQVHTVIHKSTHRLSSHCSTKEWEVVIHTTAYISFLIQQHLTESPSKLVHAMLFLMAIQYLHCGIL